MSIIFRNITMIYIIFLASALGAVLYAGIVVAPVIFGSDSVFGDTILSQYQEGIIMSENFIRLSYAVTLSAIVIFLYEGYKYKMGERDNLALVGAFLAISTAMLFSYYYIPDILFLQQIGEEATKTEKFLNLHKGSEIDFKLYAFSLLLILIRNLNRALK